jgi:hypothetical protein
MRTIHFEIKLVFERKYYENGILITYPTSIMKELQGRISDSGGVSDKESSGTVKSESFEKVLRFFQF